MRELKQCPTCQIGGCFGIRDKSTNAWKCTETGLWQYKELPEGMKEAKLSNFYHNTTLLIGMKFLVKGYYTEYYVAYHVHAMTNMQNLIQFIKDKRVFIK